MHPNDSKGFIEYSNDMDDLYKFIEEYNPNKKHKILIVFDDMFADMLSNKTPNPIVTELFIKGRNPNNSLAFNTQSYFAVPKNIKRNYTHYFIIKIPNTQKFQQIVFHHSSEFIIHHSSEFDFKDFMNFYKKCTAKPFSI